MQFTVAQVRAQLYDAVVPNVDSQANIDKFNQYLNFAVERLINSGQWLGQFDHVAFLLSRDTVHRQRHITLPPQYISVLAMCYEQPCNTGCGGTSRIPVQIRNEWLSLLAPMSNMWNAGYWPNYGFQAYSAYSTDAGDGFPTFRDSPFAGYRLKFVLENAADSGIEVLVKGGDADGNPYFTPDSSYAYEGVTVPVTYPSTTTSEIFTGQLKFIYRPASQGYIKLYAVNIIDGEEFLIGDYAPSDTNPDYKRYWVPNCKNTDTYVRTICKRRYYPLLSDQDTVVPSNLGALRLMLAGILYEKSGDSGRYEVNFNEAIRLLNDELRSARGGAALKLRIDATAFNMPGLYPGR